MPNSNHVEVLKKGIDAWNIWRKENPSIEPDLQSVDFDSLKLTKVKGFPQEQMQRNMSFQEAIALEKKFPWYKQKIDLRGINFSDTVLTKVNLNHAYLEGVNLTNARLDFSTLRESILDRANLNNANLTGANFRRAFLNGSTIEDADLTAADFSYAILQHASLQDSLLSRTIFVGTNLRNASFKNAFFDATVLGDAMLEGVRELESANHYGPSSIVDPQTVIRSRGLPARFLRGCGWPKTLIDTTIAIHKQQSYFSCFISYSHKDEDFARRIQSDLVDRGAKCFYAPKDLDIGAKIRSSLDHEIGKHEKLLLILSASSIGSQWVEQEVERALEKERHLKKEHGHEELVLLPVKIDDTIFDSEAGWANLLKNTRNIGDFSNWQDAEHYSKSLHRILNALQKA